MQRTPVKVSMLMRALSILALLMTSLTTVVMISASPASAAHCGPQTPPALCVHAGGNGNTIGQPPTGGQGDDPGTGTGGGGDGDGGGVIVIVDGYTRPIYSTNPGSVPRCLGACGSPDASGATSTYGGGCSPPNNSQWGPYEGVEINEYWIYTEIGSQRGSTNYTSAGHRCIFPPAYTDTPIDCPTHYGARFQGPYYDMGTVEGRGFVNTLLNGGRTPTPFEAQGAENGPNDVSLCQRGFSEDYRVDIEDLGQYRLTSVGDYRPCVLRQYRRVDQATRVIPDDDIISCGGRLRFPFERVVGQKFCAPPEWELRWTNEHTFTYEECLDDETEPAGYTCGPEVFQYGTYAGRGSRRIDAIDDGDSKMLSWRTIRPNARVRNISDQQTRLWYRTGTPRREGVPTHDPTQPFVTTPVIDRWVDGWRGAATGNRTGWQVAFQGEGVPDSPWTVRPQWMFDAEFLMSRIIITSVNFRTGEVEYERRQVWVPVDDVICTGRPAALDVHRARNSPVR